MYKNCEEMAGNFEKNSLNFLNFKITLEKVLSEETAENVDHTAGKYLLNPRRFLKNSKGIFFNFMKNCGWGRGL